MELILGIYHKTPERDAGLLKKMQQLFINDPSFTCSVTEHTSLTVIKRCNQVAECFADNPQKNCHTAGRIYGMPPYFSQSKHSDNVAATIFKAFSEKGPSVFNAIDGEFSCLIYDDVAKHLHLANDIWGLFPVFYYESDLYFVFCNMYEPLLALEGVADNYDFNALQSYFNLGAVTGEATFFEKVKILPPASYIEIQNNVVSISRYGALDVAVQYELKAEEAAVQMAVLFRKAVQKRIRYIDSSCEALLTGGADTRLILCCLTEEQQAALSFSTYITPPLTTKNDSDALIASEIAGFLGLKHSFNIFDFWDGPFSANYFIKKTKQAKSNLISGHFGSELFKSELYNALDKRLQDFYGNDMSGLNEDVFKKNSYRENSEHITNNFSHIENKRKAFLFDRMCRSFFTLTWQGSRSIYFDQPVYMPHILIMPFLDRDVISFFLGLPDSILGVSHDKLYNLLFKKHFPLLNHIPSNSPIAGEASALKKYKLGKEPFSSRQYNYEQAFKSIFSDKDITAKYNPSFLGKISKPEFMSFKQSFIDFEVWSKYTQIVCSEI